MKCQNNALQLVKITLYYVILHSRLSKSNWYTQGGHLIWFGAMEPLSPGHFRIEIIYNNRITSIRSLIRILSKGRYTLSVKLSDFTVWHHTWRKNWVNCAVLTGNSAGIRTALSSRLSQKSTAQFTRGIPHTFRSVLRTVFLHSLT
jgi:hypothetical protein